MGSVLFATTVGEILVELPWVKECPLASRSFLQHSLNGYFTGCEFFKVFPNELCITGDPSNTGFGGVSAFSDRPRFPLEFNKRVASVTRGLLGLVPEDNLNGSQFFITFDQANVLARHFTIFARVSNDTIWNVMKINDLILDDEGRPLMPPVITATKVLNDPFGLQPEIPDQEQGTPDEEPSEPPASPPVVKASKNRSLLTFADDEEEEEEEI